jgi:hypothetical protein
MDEKREIILTGSRHLIIHPWMKSERSYSQVVGIPSSIHPSIHLFYKVSLLKKVKICSYEKSYSQIIDIPSFIHPSIHP